MDEREDEERERPRPRVVDKRISARPPGTASEPSPPVEAPQAPPEAPAAPPEPEAPAAPVVPGPAPSEVWTPEAEAEARRAAEEMVAIPATDWVVNMAVTLANVAGVKIDAGALDDARVAIDAFAGLLDGAAGRLGDAEPPLRQVLAQLRMGFADRVAPPPQTPHGAG